MKAILIILNSNFSFVNQISKGMLAYLAQTTLPNNY